MKGYEQLIYEETTVQSTRREAKKEKPRTELEKGGHSEQGKQKKTLPNQLPEKG